MQLCNYATLGLFAVKILQKIIVLRPITITSFPKSYKTQYTSVTFGRNKRHTWTNTLMSDLGVKLNSTYYTIYVLR